MSHFVLQVGHRPTACSSAEMIQMCIQATLGCAKHRAVRIGMAGKEAIEAATAY